MQSLEEIKNEPYVFNETELRPEYLSLQALIPVGSSSNCVRQCMFSGHFGQSLVFCEGNDPYLITGVEREFSKYTLSTKIPENGRIINVIERYPQTLYDNIKDNPELFVVFYNEEKSELDCLSITNFTRNHQHFGFENKMKPTLSMLKPGNYVPKDTIFCDSPAVGDNGEYKHGLNFNVCFMDDPAVSEDGILISDRACERAKFKVYETRVCEVGKNNFLLNIFGNDDNYKPFQEIGEMIPKEGYVFSQREYDDDLAPGLLGVYDMQDIDHIFDRTTYTRGEGKVIDIKVIKNGYIRNPTCPEETTYLLDKYAKAYLKFNKSIIETVENFKSLNKNIVFKMSPNLHRRLIESMAVIENSKPNTSLNLNYKKAELDEYRIEITIEHIIVPTLGFKLTCMVGGKGVIVGIRPWQDMPVDSDGNYADIVMSKESTANRMNYTRFFHQYFNGACRDIRKDILCMLDIKNNKITLRELKKIDKNIFINVIEHLGNLYKYTSSYQYEHYLTFTEDDYYEHIYYIINNKVKLLLPAQNKRNYVEAVKAIERWRPPTYGPVSFKGITGKNIHTKHKVRIAPLYMMLLDKVTDDGLVVSSAKLHPTGVLAPNSDSEKFTNPVKLSPVRGTGESEVRILLSYLGSLLTAEIMDRNNNPKIHQKIYRKILESDVPTNIEKLINRDEDPYGGSMPLKLVKHILYCFGVKLVYEKNSKN